MKRFATLALAVTALASGCSSHRIVAPDQTRESATHAMPAAWKAVINDWYYGGINHHHSCAAVRAAVAHLPEEDCVLAPGCTVRADLNVYERRVC